MEVKKTELNKKALKELTRKDYISSIVFLIAGAATLGISIYLVIKNHDSLSYILLALGILMIVAGTYILAALLINYWKIDKNPQSIRLNFANNELIVTTSKDEKVVAANKFKYSDFKYYRVSKNYIFLYVNRRSALPIALNNNGKEIIEFLDKKQIRRR